MSSCAVKHALPNLTYSARSFCHPFPFMPLRDTGAFFAKLLPAIHSDLRRIAARSCGETTIEDLQAEAWLVAEALSRGRVPPPDMADSAIHQLILGRLYNRFVKFADQRLRFAVRLDVRHEDDDGGTRDNAIAASLSAPDEYDPSVGLSAREERSAKELQLIGRFAEAVAYFRVFANMGNDRRAIAHHLAVGASTLRRRLRLAAQVIEWQPSLFDGVTAIPDDFKPPFCNRRLCAKAARGARKNRYPRLQARLFRCAYIPIRPF